MAKTKTTWKKGNSGNPNGRPVGTGRVDEYRAILEPDVPAILTKLVEQARDGNLWAVRMILERVYPVRDAAVADILADIDELRTLIEAKKSPSPDPDVAKLLEEIEALRKQVHKGAVQ